MAFPQERTYEKIVLSSGGKSREQLDGAAWKGDDLATRAALPISLPNGEANMALKMYLF
jgi:hypothetical protein